MKNIISTLTLCLLTNMVFAQTIDVKFSQDKEVYLNDLKLEKSVSLENIKAQLGEPVVFKEYTTGKTVYHFADLGIAVHFVNDELLFFGVNLNWDGDKSFPERPYEGTLKIGNVEIEKSSNHEFISKIEVVEIFCPIASMCMTKDREAKILILIGFKDDLVTQVGFEFHE